MKQSEPKRSNATHKPATTIHDQFFVTMSTTKQILTIPLLTEDALFTWVLLFTYFFLFVIEMWHNVCSGLFASS